MRRISFWTSAGLLIVLGALGAGVALGDRPPWPEYPAECVAEHGVCFHQFERLTLRAADFDGEVVFGQFDTNINDFMRQNPDGTNFMHFVTQTDNETFYCPAGAGDCWPSVEPARVSLSGLVVLDPDSGAFAPACPYSAQASSVHISPGGDLFEARTVINLVNDPEGGCRVVDLDIRIRPAPGN